MGGLRNGKGFGVCKAYFGVYAGCFVSCVKLWFCSWLRFWCESKGWRFLQALVIASLFVPAVAYAVPGYQSGLAGVIQGPSAWYEYGASVDDPYYGYFCYAYDKYDAAVWSLGLDPTDASFTSEVKAKLSNASTGGRFYTYADKFHTFGANSEPHAWLSRDFYGQWVTLYGRDFLYWGEVTTAEQDGAKADLQTILNGGNLGGGSVSGEYIEFVGNWYYINGSTNAELYANSHFFDNGLNSTTDYIFDSPFTLRVKSAGLESFFASYPPASNDYFAMLTVTSSNQANVRIYAGDFTFTVGTNTNVNSNFPQYLNTTYFKRFDGNVHYVDLPAANYRNYVLEYTGTVCTGVTVNTQASNPTVNAATTGTVGSNQVFLKIKSGIPDSNWPESDPVEAPQPPELPEPDNPVIDDEPDSTFPIYVDVSTTNYTADLQGVLDAMDDHCIHLQESIWWGFNNFWNKLYQYITWSVGVMQSEFAATRDYLHDLFEWLAEQFDYSVSGGAYNDSTVVSWLKKIYSSLGLGVNTRPTDPVADPDGIGDWLGQLFANFIAWLAGFGAGLVAGLADDFAELTTKFPFSIPWDIGAMLALVVAEPVAPSFEYPLYTLDASGSLVESGVVEVDLSVFDSYMVGIRFMQKLLFCLMLAWRTADLKELLRIGRSR